MDSKSIAKNMQFGLRDLLAATTVIAISLALRMLGPIRSHTCRSLFVFSHWTRSVPSDPQLKPLSVLPETTVSLAVFYCYRRHVSLG